MRIVIYFVSWILIAYFLTTRKKAQKFSAGALIFLGVSITWAAVDWQMSLEPLWYSTIYGLAFAIGQAFGAWAFTLLICKILLYYQQNIFVPPKINLDLGNLLLTLIILWAYVSFMQYLIVWSANLPDEVTWFNKRVHHGWQYILMIIFLFQFLAPFFVLLFRDIKYRNTSMIILTSLVLLIRILDRYWMIMPAFSPTAISFSYVDLTLCCGLGGIWIAMFLYNLNQHPYFTLEDANWPKAQQVMIHA